MVMKMTKNEKLTIKNLSALAELAKKHQFLFEESDEGLHLTPKPGVNKTRYTFSNADIRDTVIFLSGYDAAYNEMNRDQSAMA